MLRYLLQLAVLGLLTGVLGSPPGAANDSLQAGATPSPSATVSQGVPSNAPVAPASRAPEQTILVFPFENQSRIASLEWLGEGLAELTTSRLDGGSRFVFSREDRLDALERMGLPSSAQFTVATMIEIGRQIGADDVVFGSYTSDNKNISVTARVLRLNTPQLSDPLTAAGPLANVLAVQARLAGAMACALAAGACPGGVPPAGVTDAHRPPSSLAAFELYMHAVTGPTDDQRLRDLRDATRLEPDWDLPAFELGLEDFQRRDCESALMWLSRVPPARPRGVEATFDAGVCHLLGNDATRAASSFQDVIDERATAGLDPPEAHNDLGVALLRLGQFSDAVAQFQRATLASSDTADFYFNLGIAQFLNGDTAQAQTDLHRAQTLAPGDAGIRDAIAQTAAMAPPGSQPPPAPARTATANRKSHAENSFNGAESQPPEQSETIQWTTRTRIAQHLDRAWLRPGGEGNAAANASAAVEAGRPAPQEDVSFHLQHGQQFLVSGNLDDAQRAFTEALLLAPYDAAAHRGLAEVYRRQGRPEDALRELSDAISNLNDAPTHVEMAQLLIEMNRSSDARDQLHQALAIDPGNAQAHQLLDKMDGSAEGSKDTGGTQ